MTVDDLERAAEKAYAAMYEARRPKEPYEDAMLAFGEAIEMATGAGLTDTVARLCARRDHVREVYEKQFRWV